MKSHQAQYGDVLSAWLHLTNSCNLFCPYCYVRKDSRSMDPDTARCAVEAVFLAATRHHFKKIQLKYAGGEPVLQFPLMLALHRQARGLAEKNGLEFEGVLLTNGSALTDAMITTLVAEQITISISMDGIGIYHNIHRSTKTRGSFEQVVWALEKFLQLGCQPEITITLSAQNLPGLRELVSFLLERNLRFSFNFYRESILTAQRENLALENQAVIAALYEAFQAIEANLPRYSLLGALLDRTNLASSHTYPCDAGLAYLVIDTGGNISRCHMDMEHPVTSIEALDPLTDLRIHPLGFQNIPVQEKSGCGSCEWQGWCAGGCPLLSYRTIGRSDVPSPYCAIYKAALPAILRLEGLRLLKWGQPGL